MILSSSRRFAVAATTTGVALAVVGCAPTDGPPCFDGTYEVEFLERLPESDCPEPWAAGWRFTAEPVWVAPSPDVCSSVALRVIGDPPPRDLGVAVASAVFPHPIVGAGALEYPLEGDASACEAVTDLWAVFPDVGYANVAESAVDDAVIWGVAVNELTEECGVAIPEGAACTDYYRSRMTKIADWEPE